MSPPTPSEQQLLRTTDLSMAAFLITQGFAPQLERMPDEVKEGHPQGAWTFTETDTVRDLVDDYRAGDARVEPRAFQQAINTTRRAMFQFLGIGQK